MVWEASQPYKAESKKIVWEVAPYLRGRGIDLGAGEFKVLPHVISVDNGDHEQFGFSIRPDVRIETAERLEVFGSRSMDFVYSSHLLEHIEDYKAALKEWWRLVKVGGFLVLYLPHKELYPNMGQPGANPTHKHDFLPEDIVAAMEEVGSWDLIENQRRSDNDEYSMLLVFKKFDNNKRREYSWQPSPGKTALVCRFGAFGDLMQASSVFSGLKKQGYHVTLMTSPPGVDVVLHDPNIDKFMLLDKDQIPNANLIDFWSWQSKKYDKFVNLSESVEGTFLAMPGRVQHTWPPELRHQMMNMNYMEFQHRLAGVPNELNIKFYPTEEEKAWAKKERMKMGEGPVVLWSLAGSSGHKTWAGLDNILAASLLNFPKVHFVLVGGPECAMLEAGWENEVRVHRTCGKWSIRQSLSFLYEADLVIGPETGVLNAAACMEVPKICFLSHSSWENLTKGWKNTVAVWSDKTTCKGRGFNLVDGKNPVTACHQMHYGWEHCPRDKDQGVAQCQADISVEEVWNEVAGCLESITKKIANDY